MLALIYLLLGLIGLWLGTELIIRGALTIAEYYKLSHVFIGLTILAIGTDLPELIVAIDASLLQNSGQETSGIIIGNALGSCLNQITIVLGIAGMLGYLTLTKKAIKQDGLVLVGAIILFFLVGFDGTISTIEGFSLIIVYLIYYVRLLYGEKVPEKLKKELPKKIWQNLIYLLGGIGLVIFTSDVVVNNAIALAELWDVPQSFIGIVFIALGTSLPELAISLNAARKKAVGLSVGNIIGSNIFDLMVPVGVGASLSDLDVASNLLWRDLPVLFLVTVVVLIFFSKKKGLQRKEAISLVGIYLLYVIIKVLGF
ncbi:MAG: calcium/sodium antiporter [Cyclobacteriaceae bacterium]